MNTAELKSSFLGNTDTRELFVLNEHWKSDVDFFRDELKIFKKIMVEKTLWLEKDFSEVKYGAVEMQIKDLEKRVVGTQRLIDKQLREMELMYQNPFVFDESILMTEQEKIQSQITLITKDFRDLKRVVYLTTEEEL